MLNFFTRLFIMGTVFGAISYGFFWVARWGYEERIEAAYHFKDPTLAQEAAFWGGGVVGIIFGIFVIVCLIMAVVALFSWGLGMNHGEDEAPAARPVSDYVWDHATDDDAR